MFLFSQRYGLELSAKHERSNGGKEQQQHSAAAIFEQTELRRFAHFDQHEELNGSADCRRERQVEEQVRGGRTQTKRVDSRTRKG